MVALLMPGEVREVEIVINDRVDEVTSVGEVEYIAKVTYTLIRIIKH